MSAAQQGALARVARACIPAGASVLELGCRRGDLLAALAPRRGLGIDLSPGRVEQARARHAARPALEFRTGDAHDLPLDETFDFVVAADLIGRLDDVWAALRSLRRVMRPDSRLLLLTANGLREPLRRLGRALDRRPGRPARHELGARALANLLALNGLTVEASVGGRLSRVAHLLARPRWHEQPAPRALSCSVIVPCKDERDNIAGVFARTPSLGAGTELIFVDGRSQDGTVAEIERLLPTRPGARLLHQDGGVGKGDAVRRGFAAATGEVLFILDADLTVPPEDLPKFYLALAEGKGELVNGSRLVYPMEGEAMRRLNLAANKFFGRVFSYLLGQPVTDTLCGTKVVRRDSYERIAAGRAHFGNFDPFGDFDLLFGAARAGLPIVEVPVRYRRRTYGDTKIDRFRHGWLLLRMTALGFRKLKLA